MKTLKKGSKGADVKTLQTLLGIKSDGIFGKQTKSAVIAYQKKNGLVADGIVGKKTWAKLQAKKTTTVAVKAPTVSVSSGKPHTAHFKASEFKCHNGEEVPFKYYPNLQKLQNLLEEIRKACGDRPITITSGYRPPAYNKKVGGASKSQHIVAAAADIKVSGMLPSEVYKICDKLVGNRGGVGKYKTFTHVDVRGYRSRW